MKALQAHLVRTAHFAHVGIPVRMPNICSQNAINGWTLHYILGKGDWKYKKDWLQERRFWSNRAAQSTGVCRRCHAKSANWVDVLWMSEWYVAGESTQHTAFGDIPSPVRLRLRVVVALGSGTSSVGTHAWSTLTSCTWSGPESAVT